MAAAPYPLPGGLKSLFVGRVLYKEVDGNRVRGEVLYPSADSTSVTVLSGYCAWQACELAYNAQ